MTVITFSLFSDDDFRVKLQGEENDYVNASLVEVPLIKRKYILTQVRKWARVYILLFVILYY